MGHDCTTVRSIRPKPDKRNPIRRLGPEQQQHHLLKYLIHSSIDRPPGKRKLIPSSETPFLNMLPDAYREERTDQVIRFGQCLSLQPVAVGMFPRIQLVTEILNNLLQVKGQVYGVAVDGCVLQRVVQVAVWRISGGMSTTFAVAHRTGPKAKEPVGLRERSPQGQPDVMCGTTIVLGQAIVHLAVASFS